MPLEKLIEEYDKNRIVILNSLRKQDEIIEKIKKSSEEDLDWITVKKASRMLDVSPQYLYARNDLEKKHIGAKIYLRKSQCLSVDDKYADKV